MKKIFFVALLLFWSASGKAQEVETNQGIYVGATEIGPSLSLLAPKSLFPNLTLREVNFNETIEKREVDFSAMMMKTRFEKEKALVEIDSPLPTIGTDEKKLIEVTNEIRRFDRSSNFDIYTGEKKIPAYEEMRVPLLSRPYSDRSRFRGYVSPYYY